ncbi:MAG: DUF2628 domain-containing protein [Beijerinckiaceae bacterium]|nr:DUF2628 domain-containing protein [Beijerinckiaceae bacterium]
MALYIAQARGRDETSLEHASILRDGFSWAALIFGPFWLLYRRLWLAALIWIVLESAFILFVLPHVAPNAAALVDVLAHCFLGFEGQRLRIAKASRDAAITEIIEGRDWEEAEARFFQRQVPPPLPVFEPTSGLEAAP